MTLIEQLKQIPDHRRQRGRRYELWLLMLVVILGFLCGYRGNRPLALFAAENWSELEELIGEKLPKRTPGYSTFRRLMQALDRERWVWVFGWWCRTHLRPQAEDWVAGDGKSIKATVSGGQSSQQAFVTTVSLCTHESGIVVDMTVMDNNKMSEIVAMRQLIRQNADIPGLTYSFDALHCQRETLRLIVNQGQHYLIALKANQDKLYRACLEVIDHQAPHSVARTVEDSHGRHVTRIVSVFAAPASLQSKWSKLQSFIRVERFGQREGKPFHEVALYISDRDLDASVFLRAIQGHWTIENRLHWVRDVLFLEDLSPRRGGHAPANWSLLNCWAITLIRKRSYRTVPDGLRSLANRLSLVFGFLIHGFSAA